MTPATKSLFDRAVDGNVTAQKQLARDANEHNKKPVGVKFSHLPWNPESGKTAHLLAFCYEHGIGMSAPHSSQALAYYIIAANNHEPLAAAALRQLEDSIH